MISGYLPSFLSPSPSPSPQKSSGEEKELKGDKPEEKNAEKDKLSQFKAEENAIDKEKHLINADPSSLGLNLFETCSYHSGKLITLEKVTQTVIKILNENIKKRDTHPIGLNPVGYTLLGIDGEDPVDSIETGWIWKILNALVKANQIDAFMFDRNYTQFRVRLKQL